MILTGIDPACLMSWGSDMPGRNRLKGRVWFRRINRSHGTEFAEPKIGKVTRGEVGATVCRDTKSIDVIDRQDDGSWRTSHNRDGALENEQTGETEQPFEIDHASNSRRCLPT